MKPQQRTLLLDGRTGEGGGQLVRLACALAAVTSQPVRINNVRGNRSGGRGGGLKAQHVAAIKWLAAATDAAVDGLSVGSKTLEFRPFAPPTALKSRKITIAAETRSASTLLILQAIFPYLLYAGNADGDPIELEINGGTNCSFSLSYEYLDQVLVPTLRERYGVEIETELKVRGWTLGPNHERGSVRIKFQPIRPGQTLQLVKPWPAQFTPKDFEMKQINITILAPDLLQQPLHEALLHYLDTAFPGTQVDLVRSERTSHSAQIYALAVAHSQTGLRWGQDFLYDKGTKNKKPEKIAIDIARTISRQLRGQAIDRGTPFDEYLEDQLIVFQALSNAATEYPVLEAGHLDSRDGADPDEEINGLIEGIKSIPSEKRMRKDKTHEPFGNGSTHTTTARWVVSELMPTIEWFNKGSICKGAGVSFDVSIDNGLSRSDLAVQPQSSEVANP
ncbi:RNA 3'-terminal phosphate cyclase [Xylariaceae sp. FL0255]|nr:RNA 3'-terminal phosphate cyclase [Xylariaceae sp. FL0255]